MQKATSKAIKTINKAVNSRPKGRKANVQGNGYGLTRRGNGLGTGPVGSFETAQAAYRKRNK